MARVAWLLSGAVASVVATGSALACSANFGAVALHQETRGSVASIVAKMTSVVMAERGLTNPIQVAADGDVLQAIARDEGGGA